MATPRRLVASLVIAASFVAGHALVGCSDDESASGTTGTDDDASTPVPSVPGDDGGAPSVDGSPPPQVDAAVDAGWPVYDGGTAGNGDYVIGPNYTNAPELTVPAAAPRGKVYAFTMDSKTSKIYPGVSGAYTRAVSVYVPKPFVSGVPTPFIVVQDGSGYVDSMKNALDTLIFQKRVPPMVAIMINPGPGDGRGSERGLEYDRVSEDYTRFIETEVLPIIPKQPAIKADIPDLVFTQNPEGRAAMGCSSGGAAAFTMGWFRPDLYRRILTYSGTFVNQYPEPAYPHGAWGYHESLVAAAAQKPLRVFLQVGENDNNLDAAFKDGMHNWIKANQAMAAVLKTKAYPYRFVFAKGATHCSGAVRGQTLPESLVWLWQGYPIP